MICSFVNLERFIVRKPFQKPDSTQIWRKERGSGQDYYRSTRLMCSALFATGSYHHHVEAIDASGAHPKGTLPQLQGILSHIYQIKPLEKIRSPQIIQPNALRQGIERLYERFLFYRRFVVLTKPLIICEGKTDSIYLDAAVRELRYAGKLFNVDGARKINAIQYFRYSRTSQGVMSLSMRHLTAPHGNSLGFQRRLLQT